MVKSAEESRERDNRDSRNRESLLVLSIDQNGKIVQFNKECEKIAGYSRDEVLDRELFNFLIPEHYFEQWEKMFDSARRNEAINDFELPWLTQQGYEIMVSWSSFPVESIGDTVGNICLVGKFITPPGDIGESIIEHTEKEIEDKSDAGEIDEKKDNMREKNIVLFRLGNKNIVFGRDYPAGSRDAFGDRKVRVSSKKEKKKETVKIKSEKKVEKKKINENYGNLVESYSDIDKTIKKLEERNKELEKENKRLERNLKSFKTRLANKKEKSKKLKREKPDKTRLSIKRKTMNLFGRWVYPLFDSLGQRRKKEEFERMIQELEERKSLLDDLETQLINDKKNIDEKRNEFCRWREKLEVLENEIENRREELVDQERMLSDRFAAYLDESTRDKSTESDVELTSEVERGKETSEHHEILDKIPECAAIVQRGMLKQINRSFAQLLGYEMEELVEKSLLDFVAPEGFSEIEEYYLNRLKGEAVSTYETVFLTSDDRKIRVEISIKPVSYDGEKADMAVVRTLADIEQEKENN